MKTTFRSALAASLLPALLAPLAAPQSTSEEAPGRLLASTVFRGEGEAVCFVLRRPRGLGASLAAELHRLPFRPGLAPSAVTPGGNEPLWSGPWPGPAWARELSYASWESGGWALIGTMNGGGTHHLPYWSSAGTSPVEFRAIHTVSLENATRLDAAEPATLVDLFAPQLLEWRGGRYVIGAGHGDHRPFLTGNESVWIAPLPDLEDRPEAGVDPFGGGGYVRARLSGRLIADGSDPRVLVLADGVLLAVREVENFAHLRGHAPVAFYRSGDLETWVRDAELSRGVSGASNYDVAVDRGTAWLATTNEDESPGILLHRFDAEARAWEPAASLRPEGNPVRSVTDPIWLFPSSLADVQGLEVVFTGAEGRLEQRQP